MNDDTAFAPALGALLVGAHALSADALLGALADKAGVHWPPEALAILVAANGPALEDNSPLARADRRALRRALNDLRRKFQQAHGKQPSMPAFERVVALGSSLAQAQPTSFASVGAAQQALARALDQLLDGLDATQVLWLKEQVLEQVARRVLEELAGDLDAWDVFYSWLTQQTAQQDALVRTVPQLPAVLHQLQDGTAALSALDDAPACLDARLAALHDELRRVAAGDAPAVAPAPARIHNQQIGGQAQVGVAIAGDVQGGVTHTQQSGGVNLGTRNQIGSIDDIVGGDKFGGDKVMGNQYIYVNPSWSPGGPSSSANSAPDVSDEAHIQTLIRQKTRRLQVLEIQAAQEGRSVRPEVAIEIDSIRADLQQLRAMRDSRQGRK